MVATTLSIYIPNLVTESVLLDWSSDNYERRRSSVNLNNRNVDRIRLNYKRITSLEDKCSFKDFVGQGMLKL